MRMRYLGAILILAACAAAGFIYISAVKKRICALESLCTALELAAGELKTRAAPIPELCALLERRSDNAAAKFFARLSGDLESLGEKTFSDLWGAAVEDELACLLPDERQELTGLGSVLGRYELAQQENALTACVFALRASLTHARESYPGQRRLGFGLTAAAGALIVVILL